MDDLTLIRAFRGDAPVAEPPSAVRTRALTPPSQSTPRMSRRLVVSGLVTAAIATPIVIVAGQAGHGDSTSAAAELGQAAYTVANRATPKPRDRQWVLETSATHADPHTWAAAWNRFDGREFAQYQGGEEGGNYERRRGQTIEIQTLEKHQAVPSPKQWWEGLSALPEDPARLLESLSDGDLLRGPLRPKGDTRAARDFDAVTTCLSQAPAIAPRAHARLFRALATIRGVGITRHATDATDRRVIAITFDGHSGTKLRVASRSELLLDPSTYAYRGFRQTALKDGVLGSGKPTDLHVKKGQIWFDEAEPLSAIVNNPGQHP